MGGLFRTLSEPEGTICGSGDLSAGFPLLVGTFGNLRSGLGGSWVTGRFSGICAQSDPEGSYKPTGFSEHMENSDKLGPGEGGL